MVTPYILFHGNCKEAMDFYEKALDGKNKTMIPYGDYETPDGKNLPDNKKNYIMHGEMVICETNFWFADEIEPFAHGNTIQLTLHYQSEEEAVKAYNSLLEGGKSLLAPTPQYYCAVQAAVEDKYGNRWHMIGMEKNSAGI